MKFVKVIKSAKAEGMKIAFDCTAGSLELNVLRDMKHDRDNIKNLLNIGCWSGGNRSNGDYYKEGPENSDATFEDAKAILPELEQICSEFDNKVIALMEKYGYRHE